LALLRAITEARATLDAVIGGHSIGDTASVSTTHCAVVSGYLLAWNILLNLFVSVAPERRVEYATYVRRENLVGQLLSDVFRLLPASPALPVSGDVTSPTSSNKVCRQNCLLNKTYFLFIWHFFNFCPFSWFLFLGFYFCFFVVARDFWLSVIIVSVYFFHKCK